MLSPAAATEAIAIHAPRLPTIPVALRDAAGCVLKQTVYAERDQPPFDRVSMDGIALVSDRVLAGQRDFRIAGTQAAGAAPLTLPSDNDCIETMTGAMLPAGCDCVIPVERIAIRNDHAHLSDAAEATPWLNLHRRGIDCRAGIVHVQVARMPRIVVISTGDELVEPGKPLSDWQIRRSNVYGVLAALRNHGYTRLADDHIADDEAVLRQRLSKHLDNADVLILSGGVSMGKFDFVPKILTELGVQQIFHKIAQRPGKPMWFGVRDDGKAVYALPGNPVSTLVCLARYVLPGLRAALGAAHQAPEVALLASECKILPSLSTLLPVRVNLDAAGQLRATPQPTQGSGDFTSLIGSHGCVELPPGSGTFPLDSSVKFYRW
jgi:molybdopterin molybdotransferase